MGLPVVPAGVAMALIEVGKLGLQAWLQAGRQAGKTREEMDQMYNSESVRFDSHHPDSWADVPKDEKTEGSDPE